MMPAAGLHDMDYVCLPASFTLQSSIATAAKSRGLSMTREERAQQLNRIRQSDPKRLITTYRTATHMHAMDQLPRGLGFTGMIEAILESEYDAEEVHCELQKVADEPLQHFEFQQIVAASVEQAPQPHRPTLMGELRAFCSGVAMVGTGLLMAAHYFMVKHQISA
jgi:hypothetical protein